MHPRSHSLRRPASGSEAWRRKYRILSLCGRQPICLGRWVVVANSSWSGGKAIRRSVMADYAGAYPSYALWSTHGKTPDLHNELRKRLPTLHCESREKGTHKSRGRSGHLLVDRLWSEAAGNSTGKTD